MKYNVHHLALCAVLTALALALSYLEHAAHGPAGSPAGL